MGKVKKYIDTNFNPTTKNFYDPSQGGWEANLDIQPVFNHYKAISYMCAYLSQTEGECSHAIQEKFKDAFNKNLVQCSRMQCSRMCIPRFTRTMV